MATVAGSLRNKVLVVDDLTSGDITVTDLVVSGTVTLQGTATTLDSTNTTVTDSIIELNSGLTGGNVNDIGLILERGSTGNNVFIGWDESADKVVAGLTTDTGSSTGNLSLTYANFQAANATFTGSVTATTIDTGQGATEVYLMNQNVRTTDSPSFGGLYFPNANSRIYGGSTHRALEPHVDGSQLQLGEGYGLINLFKTQNASNELKLWNNRQDLSNVEVSKVSGYNGGEVANMKFYRGGGGSSGFIRFQNKPTNAAALTDVFQVGDGGTVGYGVDILAGGLRVAGTTVIDASNNLTNIGTISSGAITAPTVNTGQGANELYAMNQNIRTTDSPTFGGLTLNGGVQFNGYNINGINQINAIGSTGWLDFNMDTDSVYPQSTSDNQTVLGSVTHMNFVGDSNGNGTGGVFYWGYGVNNADSGTFTETMELDRSGNLEITGQLTASTVNTGQGATEVYLMNQNVRTTDSPTFGGLTTTGNIVAEDSEVHVGDISGDNWTRIKHAQADGYGFDFQHDNATVIVNEQGSTNQVMVLGDVDAANYSGLFGVAHTTNSGTAWTKKLDLRGNGELYIGASGTNQVYHEGHKPTYAELGTMAYSNLTGTPTIPSLSGYATESYVGTQISNLVDSAPGSLDTLNELAAALGDDANFSTTITNSIATKLPLTGGTLTGTLTTANSLKVTGTASSNSSPATDQVELSGYGLIGNRGNVYITNANASGQIVMGISGAHNANPKLTVTTSGITVGGTVSATGGNSGNWNTAYGWGNHASAGYLASSSYTAADVLTKIKTVDGTGSGLDADKLDNQEGSYYLNYNNFTNTPTSLPANGGNSDTVDNLHAASFLRSDTADTATGNIDFARASFGTASLHTTGGTHGVVTDSFSLHSGASDLMYIRPSSLRADNGFFQWQTYNGGNGGDIELQPYGGSVTISTGSGAASTANGLRFQTGSGSYSDGRWQHRFRKQDKGGGVPLYIDVSTTTANSFTELARFGSYSGNNYEFEVQGDINATGNLYDGGNQVFHEGYHPNADKWTTARTLTLGGDLSGNVSFDGSANFTLTATVADDSHNHIISNVDGLQAALDNKTSLDHFRHTGHGHYVSTTTSALLTEALGDDAFDSKLTAHKTGWSYAGNGDLTDAGRLTELAGTSWLWWTDNSADNVQGNITALAIAPNTGGSAGKMFVYNNQGSGYSPGWREIWTSTSDGSGSGLDADKLDGQEGSYYLNYNNFTNTPTIPTDTNYYLDDITKSGNTLTFSVNGATNQTYTFGSNAFNSTTIPTNNNQLTNGAGYTTFTANQSLNTSSSPTFNQITTTNNGSGTNIRIGDDAWFGDTNVANTIQITGVQDSTKGYIVFGSSNDTALGRSGTGNLTYGADNVFHDGYHPNADKWTTARTISLTGAVTGSTSIDGSGNVSIATTATSDPTLTLSGDASGSATFTNLGNATLNVTINNDSHNHNHSDGDFTVNGGLVVEGSKDSGATNMGFYESAGTNLILKGDTNGRSGIFFESEKNGTNINDPSDYGFIQFHSYGYGSTSGENADFVIGVSNDSADHVIIQSPYNGGVKVGYKDATSGTGLTTQTIFHDAYHPNADKWTTDRAFLINLTGAVTGNATVQVDGSSNETWTISTSLATGDFGSANIATSGYIETNGYYHDGDGDTGMVFPGVDQIDVLAGGTTMMRFRQEDSNADYISMFGATVSGEFLFYDNGNFHADGNITAYSSNTSSDIRLKKNVRPLENCLDKVLGLDGVIFDWKKDSRGKDQVGFIAQQVEEHAPELVSTSEDKDIGEVKTINYDGAIPMLVEALKEQQSIINRLESRIKDLEDKG